MAGEGLAITFVLLIGFLILLIIALAIFALVFWIMMLVDAAKRKFKDSTERVLWIILMVFTGLIGAIIYYFVVKKK